MGKTEFNNIYDDAVKRLENRNSENTYIFEGMNLEVPLAENEMYATHGSNSFPIFLSEIEAQDSSFINSYKLLPDDLKNKLEKGIIQDQGSILYHLKLKDKSRGDIIQHTVLYQKGNPLIERFNIGYQEGVFFQRAKRPEIIIDLWNKNREIIAPNYASKEIRMGEINCLEDGLDSQVLSNLAGLYATAQEYEPEISFRTIAEGSGTYAFFKALGLLGVNESFDYVECEETENIRKVIEGEFFEIPKEWLSIHFRLRLFLFLFPLFKEDIGGFINEIYAK